jgi:hypothetical protein
MIFGHPDMVEDGMLSWRNRIAEPSRLRPGTGA